MIDEGYIKFELDWEKSDPIERQYFFELEKIRTLLYKAGLIGMYENGIGFGNISNRIINTDQFIISGTQTGGLSTLDGRHYSLVKKVVLEKNYCACAGPIRASSESMTHASIFKIAPSINYVIHIHSAFHWNRLLDKIPTTVKVPYGTPEMGKEIIRLFSESKVAKKRIILMAGHEEGLISFGENPEEALIPLIENGILSDK